MTLLENRSADIPAPRVITTQPRRSDQIFRAVVTVGGMTSLVILGLIALFLSLKGISVLQVEKFCPVLSATHQNDEAPKTKEK